MLYYIMFSTLPVAFLVRQKERQTTVMLRNLPTGCSIAFVARKHHRATCFSPKQELLGFLIHSVEQVQIAI